MSEDKKQFSFGADGLLAFIWSRRKQLSIIVILAVICSTIVAFVLPVRFKATTIMFASQDNNVAKNLLSDQPYSKDYLAFGDEKDCEQMLQVIKSSEVMNAIARKYDLMKYWGIPENGPDKYALLKDYYNDNFSFSITEYQSIKVDVYDKDPVMAANMANSVVAYSDSIFKVIVGQRAKAAFEVVKQQYDSGMNTLAHMEDSMNFFRNLGMLNFDIQLKELTRGYAEALVKGSAADAEKLLNQINLFNTYGKPYWTLAYKLSDEYKWMQTVKDNYIRAKTSAEKIIAPFFVVEKATPPDKKAYPIRWLVVVGCTIAALFFGLIALLLIDRFSSLK